VILDVKDTDSVLHVNDAASPQSPELGTSLLVRLLLGALSVLAVVAEAAENGRGA
jgi:hypothetical protein